MCFGCSKEPSHRDGTFENPQHMFLLINKKNNFQLHPLIWGPAVIYFFFPFGYTARMFRYTAQMFEYTVQIFWSNVSRFLNVFSSISRKLYTIFQPTFFPIKRYQDILFKLLTLSKDSVTKKITVVRAVYFYNSYSIFATKNFVTKSVLSIGQKYFNIALVLQDQWFTIFTRPANTCTHPLKVYAIKIIRG